MASVAVAGGIATVYGCTIQGDVPERRVVEIAEQLAAAGADEIILADTVGYGGPAQVRRIVSDVSRVIGNTPVAAHFHDTRGLGLANVTAAVETCCGSNLACAPQAPSRFPGLRQGSHSCKGWGSQDLEREC